MQYVAVKFKGNIVRLQRTATCSYNRYLSRAYRDYTCVGCVDCDAKCQSDLCGGPSVCQLCYHVYTLYYNKVKSIYFTFIYFVQCLSGKENRPRDVHSNSETICTEVQN